MKKIKNLNNIKDINSVLKAILGKGFFAKEIILDFELDESKKESKKTNTRTNTRQKPEKEKLIKITDEMNLKNNNIISSIDIRLIEEVKSHMTISILDNDFTSLEKPVMDNNDDADNIGTEKNNRILSDLSCFDLDNV